MKEIWVRSIGWMIVTGESISFGDKSVPQPLCPPKIALARDRNQSKTRYLWLTFWGMAWHGQNYFYSRLISSLFCDLKKRRLVVTDVSGQPTGPIFDGQGTVWPLKMGPLTNLRYVKSQNSKHRLYTAAETWNKALLRVLAFVHFRPALHELAL
jgi:hypothetical protein